MTPDPAGMEVADWSSPQSCNRYAYVGNDPINFYDQLGLEPGPCPPGSTAVACSFVNRPFLQDGAGADTDAGIPLIYKPGGGGIYFVGGALPLLDPGRHKGASVCSSIPSNGETIPMQYNDLNQTINFQFNGQGALIGIGFRLTSHQEDQVAGGKITIPPWTSVGVTLNSPDTISIGFTNPVKFSLGLAGIKQAYFYTATFSNGQFTTVRGSWAPFGLSMGMARGKSSILKSALNGKGGDAARAFATNLLNVANLISRWISCWTIFGWL